MHRINGMLTRFLCFSSMFPSGRVIVIKRMCYLICHWYQFSYTVPPEWVRWVPIAMRGCGAIAGITWWMDDVMKWKHFPRYRPFVRGIHRSSVNSPYKGQRRRALMFSLICIWINGWGNNREAGDLTRYRAHYDVIIMDAIPFPKYWPSGRSSMGNRWIPSQKTSHAKPVDFL